MNAEFELVEAIGSAARNLNAVANAITANDAMPGPDEIGGRVSSLTEAVMGVTSGLVRIAQAISDLADAVRERNAP